MTEQDDTIAFFADPRTHGGASVERSDTHGAIVFLAGTRALKLKRAVRYDYMDFSTVALRRQACEAEIRINRRTAPAIYRAAIPVTRDRDGILGLGGAGEIVDWVVDMVRFDQAGLFDRLAVRGALDDALAVALADTVAGFHDQADAAPGFGGAAALAATIAGNARELGRHVGTVFAADAVARLEDASRRALAHRRDLADRRRDRGRVRRCHGDLHLRNVLLIDGRPTLFDAIEFSDAFVCIDVVYDLAFLLMDLWHRELRRAANLVLNRYLWRRSDAEALALMPLFLALRAGIRAHVTATAAVRQPIAARTTFDEEARANRARQRRARPAAAHPGRDRRLVGQRQIDTGARAGAGDRSGAGRRRRSDGHDPQAAVGSRVDRPAAGGGLCAGHERTHLCRGPRRGRDGIGGGARRHRRRGPCPARRARGRG